MHQTWCSIASMIHVVIQPYPGPDDNVYTPQRAPPRRNTVTGFCSWYRRKHKQPLCVLLSIPYENIFLIFFNFFFNFGAAGSILWINIFLKKLKILHAESYSTHRSYKHLKRLRKSIIVSKILVIFDSWFTCLNNFHPCGCAYVRGLRSVEKWGGVVCLLAWNEHIHQTSFLFVSTYSLVLHSSLFFSFSNSE